MYSDGGGASEIPQSEVFSKSLENSGKIHKKSQRRYVCCKMLIKVGSLNGMGYMASEIFFRFFRIFFNLGFFRKTLNAVYLEL